MRWSLRRACERQILFHQENTTLESDVHVPEYSFQKLCIISLITRIDFSCYANPKPSLFRNLALLLHLFLSTYIWRRWGKEFPGHSDQTYKKLPENDLFWDTFCNRFCIGEKIYLKLCVFSVVYTQWVFLLAVWHFHAVVHGKYTGVYEPMLPWTRINTEYPLTYVVSPDLQPHIRNGGGYH